MRTEAVLAGFYESEYFKDRNPRIQLLTIGDLLEGKQLLYPRHRIETFRQAERKPKSKGEQVGLF